MKSLTLFKALTLIRNETQGREGIDISGKDNQERHRQHRERVVIPTTGDGMNSAPSIKLIKNAERKDRRIKIDDDAVDPKRWSTEVRSWVTEFQGRDRRETLPAFDSLFKDSSAALHKKGTAGCQPADVVA